MFLQQKLNGAGEEFRIMDEPEALAQDLGAEGLEDQSGVVVGTALKSHGLYIKWIFCLPLLVHVGLLYQ